MVSLLLSVVAGKWANESSGTNYEMTKLELRRRIFCGCVLRIEYDFSLGREEIFEGAKTPIAIIDPSVEWTISAETSTANAAGRHYEAGTSPEKLCRL